MSISLPNVRVLIAEADAELAERLQHVLEGMQVSVEWEANGSRATDRALNDKFDLLMLAIDLPIFGGHDVLSLCRQRRVSCPAIALHNVDESDTEPTLNQSGFAAAINRNLLDIEQLETTLRSALPARVEEVKKNSRIAAG